MNWRYFVVLVVFLGCKSSVPINSQPAPASTSTPTLTNAHIIVTGTQVITTSLGKPAIRVTVKNTGELAAYNVLVKIQAIKNNTIIDTGSAFPADLGNVEPGQLAVDDAVFLNLSSHSDYTSTSTDISFLGQH